MDTFNEILPSPCFCSVSLFLFLLSLHLHVFVAAEASSLLLPCCYVIATDIGSSQLGPLATYTDRPAYTGLRTTIQMLGEKQQCLCMKYVLPMRRLRAWGVAKFSIYFALL